jgi:hypothetical protein
MWFSNILEHPLVSIEFDLLAQTGWIDRIRR